MIFTLITINTANIRLPKGLKIHEEDKHYEGRV